MDYELLKDQFLLHHAWTEVDLFKLFTARYSRLTGVNILFSLQNVDECDRESRTAFWELLDSFAIKSETSVKIVVTGKEPFDLLHELHQWKDISVDVCEITARMDESTGENLDNLINLSNQHNYGIRTRLEELKAMGAEDLRAILKLIMDLTGWPQDPSEDSFHHFSSQLQALTISSTKAEIVDRTLRGISDQQGLRWVWSWISHTQRPLSYEGLAMALCYRNYQESGMKFHPPSQVEIRQASRRIRSWLRGITESCSGQVQVRNNVRLCLEDNSRYIWVELESAHKQIAAFLLEYLTAPETQKRLELMCDEYESRVRRSGESITPPLTADGQDILFYAVDALPYHLSENQLVLSEIMDGLRATDGKLAPWSRAYWAMSNPFSRPKLGTLKSPYDTLLKLGNMRTESLAILEAAGNQANSVISSIDTLIKPMELDCLVTAIGEGNEDLALSLAKDLIFLSKRESTFDVSSGCSKIAWPPWFLWRAVWLNMGRLVSLLLDDGMELSPATGASAAYDSPLHMANRLRHESIMETIFRHEATLGHEMSYNERVKTLSIAALGGKDKSLLEVRISRVTPLVVASGIGNYSDPNSGVTSTTPFAEYPKTMKILLEYKARSDVRGKSSGTTPLFYAVVARNVDLIRHQFLDRPLLMEMVNLKASHKTKCEISNVLLRDSSIAIRDAQDSQGLTPLIHAVREGDLSMVEWLLGRNAFIDHGDKHGRSALFHAFQTKHEKIVKKLLEWEPSLDCRTSAGQTLFENAGADPELPDKSGATAITTAAVKGKTIDIHRADEHGWSPLMCAAGFGSNPDIVRILIKAGADIGQSECTNYSGFTPLHAAAKGGNAEVIKKRTRKGETPLLVTRSQKCLELLILAGADINAQDHQGQTLLMRAARGEWPLTIFHQLLSELDIRVNERKDSLETALIIACHSLRTDPNVSSKTLSCSVLVATCISDQGSATGRDEKKKEIVIQLLNRGADVNAVGGHTIYNAICAASLSADSTIITSLLQKNASLTCPDPLGRLPIHFAAANGISNFKTIFRKQSDLTACDCAGRNVLHWAAQFGHVETVKFILTKMSSPRKKRVKYVNRADIDGWTPLCWAVRPSVTGFNSTNESESRKYTDTVRYLLDHGADRSVILRVGVGYCDQCFTLLRMAKLCGAGDELIALITGNRDGSIDENNNVTDRNDEHDASPQKYFSGSEYCNICLNTIFGCSYQCSSCVNFEVCKKCYERIDSYHSHFNREDGMPHTFSLSRKR
ncbi:ankyrin repeat-containing domain protein [Trichoderma austrokoningii]